MDTKKRFPIFSWLSIGCLVTFTLVRKIFANWYNGFFPTYQERAFANFLVLIVVLILLIISLIRKERNFWNRLGKKTFILGIVTMSAISI